MSEITQKQNRKTTPPTKSERISTTTSDIEFKVNFPDENPEDCIEDITDTMRHIGLFDGIAP
jgi:hypothetical protein